MFTHVVALYRASGRPPLDDGSRYSYEGPSSDHLRQTLAACAALGEEFGSFEDLPESDGNLITFTWQLAANEHARFYTNAQELVERSTRPSRGEEPRNYYLVAEDFAAGEPRQPEAISRLCTLIELIQLLATITSLVSAPGAAPNLLIFVQPAHDRTPPRTLEVPTKLTRQSIELPPPDLTELRLLAPAPAAVSLHTSERRALFRLAIAETLSKAPDVSAAFHHLIKNWDAVLEKYRYDVDCYVANFSFDKARKEVATAEVDFVSKIHGIVGDSTAKMLALPLSLAALVALYNGKTMPENYLYLLSIVCVSGLFSMALHNQALQLERIKQGFETIFAQFEDRPELYAGKLSVHINKATSAFDKQYRFSRRATVALRVLSWVPSLVGTAFVAYRYSPAVKGIVLGL